ncbi:hypothetical protein TNCT_225391 [Trichonephila clavata]|uniref:Uncharacterized protein n=1 Tax=Trichonephila clavata TaxID=2740835 RepID=A0A8X6IF63_TRICU|nr:hypothetical protein TNCT_225391 [Trichonephila clavata]
MLRPKPEVDQFPNWPAKSRNSQYRLTMTGQIAKQPISPHNDRPKSDLSLILGFGQPVREMTWGDRPKSEEKVMNTFWVFVYRNANDNYIIAAPEEFSDECAPLRLLGSSFGTKTKEVRWP